MAFQRKKPDALGVKAPLPGFVVPALASATDRVPSGERWIHEIKFDGYRVQVHLANEAVKVFTRRGHDWTKRFKKVSDDAWHSAIIDGEIVVPATDGTTDFSVLQNELTGKSTKIVLVAFDLLYLNGRDIQKLPLFQRKAELKKIIAGTDVQFSASFEIDGNEMFAHACKIGSKASSPRCATASTRSAAPIIGSRKPAPSARHSPSPASRSTTANGTAYTLLGERVLTWFTLARSTMASTRRRRPSCGGASSRWSGRHSPTRSG